VSLINEPAFTSEPYVWAMGVDIGPTVSFLDYDYNGIHNDQIFQVTSGGLGTVGLSQVAQFSGITYFYFASPYPAAGSSPGHGTSSYFFGFTSDYPPTTKSGTVWIGNYSVSTQSITVFAPAHP
jgi:hypothetical protein